MWLLCPGTVHKYIKGDTVEQAVVPVSFKWNYENEYV